MKKHKSKSSVSTAELVVLGASVAALAGAAYFFLGPKGKQHQKHAKAWVIKMKGDVVEKLEKALHISEPIYHEIIDSVAGRYEKEMKASKNEVRSLAQDLKKHWKTIGASAKAVKRDVAKNAKKVAKGLAKISK